MGRTSDIYMLMRLSYDQAEADLADKKTDNIVETYKKYHQSNLKYDSFNPSEEVLMFHDEEFQNNIESVFNNFTIRGEDKLNVVLTSVSFCIWNLQKIVGDDEKMMLMLDEVLDQYVDLPDDETYVELIKPDND
mgnify:CR=1 FL=1